MAARLRFSLSREGSLFLESQKDVCGILAHTAERHLKGLLLSIPKRHLRQLHAYPDALCALEAKIGTAFGFKTSALVVEPTDHPRGHHGYLPTRPEMKAGFFIWGKGLSHPGQPLESGSDDGRYRSDGCRNFRDYFWTLRRNRYSILI